VLCAWNSCHASHVPSWTQGFASTFSTSVAFQKHVVRIIYSTEAITQERKTKSQDHINENDTEARCFFSERGSAMCLHSRGITTSAPPYKQQLYIPASRHHRGHSAAHTRHQIVSRLHGSALIFMGPRDTKYDPNSISNLPNNDSSP